VLNQKDLRPPDAISLIKTGTGITGTQPDFKIAGLRLRRNLNSSIPLTLKALTVPATSASLIQSKEVANNRWKKKVSSVWLERKVGMLWGTKGWHNLSPHSIPGPERQGVNRENGGGIFECEKRVFWGISKRRPITLH